MFSIPQVPVKLTTICNGDLETEFEQAFKMVVDTLKSGEKGSVSILINFERGEDESDSLVTTKFKLTKKLPATNKASYIRDMRDGSYQTDAPMEQKVLFLEQPTKPLDPSMDIKTINKEA